MHPMTDPSAPLHQKVTKRDSGQITRGHTTMAGEVTSLSPIQHALSYLLFTSAPAPYPSLQGFSYLF